MKFMNLLTRGVEEVIVRENLEKKIASGKKLRIKFGIDPTAPELHLGHLVILRKLRDFQRLGHKIILIIGDFTATIGDPSGRDKTRPPLSESEVRKNLSRYLAQVKKIINLKKTEIHKNSKWFKKLDAKEIIKLTSLVSVQQLIERNDFKERINKGLSLRLHEFIYPVLQAYDSVMVKADLEIGGSDQKFNLLMGRDLMEKFKMPPQDILTMTLLEGTDGFRKMSKSYQNYIALEEEPKEMFSKIMTIPDNLIDKYFTLLTDIERPKNLDPREAKLFLAEKIVSDLHSPILAKKAKNYWLKTFSQKELPKEAPLLRLKEKKIKIIDLLLKAGIKSKSEARRLIFQKAIEINNEIKNDPKEEIEINEEVILKIGKKRFYKIKVIK